MSYRRAARPFGVSDASAIKRVQRTRRGRNRCCARARGGIVPRKPDQNGSGRWPSLMPSLISPSQRCRSNCARNVAFWPTRACSHAFSNPKGISFKKERAALRAESTWSRAQAQVLKALSGQHRSRPPGLYRRNLGQDQHDAHARFLPQRWEKEFLMATGRH